MAFDPLKNKHDRYKGNNYEPIQTVTNSNRKENQNGDYPLQQGYNKIGIS